MICDIHINQFLTILISRYNRNHLERLLGCYLLPRVTFALQ